MRPGILGIGIILLLHACNGSPEKKSVQDAGDRNIRVMEYATGFTVMDRGSYLVLEVRDPWQQSRDVIFSYVLARDAEQVPDSLGDLPFIRIPVQRVIALSTTHVAMIDQLGKGESIVGLSGTRFIYSQTIREGIEKGSIRDVGYGQGLDYEAIVRLNPDVLFLYGVEGNVMTILEKLTDLGIPAVFCGEYLETHPLGKAEWIRFLSLFYGMKEESERFFSKIDSAYNALAALASGAGTRPTVLTGLPWKDTWHMAGGRSYAAKLIEDAGGSFLWKDNPSTQAVPLDMEAVYVRAVEADVWINAGAAESLRDISLLDERLGELDVVREGMVFNNNARSSPGGGNDYWESGTLRPDLVLADLIAVFHPGLLPDHNFVYYRKLK